MLVLYSFFTLCLATRPELCLNAHDSTTNTLQKSPFINDVFLTVGGWTFSLWKDGVTVTTIARREFHILRKHKELKLFLLHCSYLPLIFVYRISTILVKNMWQYTIKRPFSLTVAPFLLIINVVGAHFMLCRTLISVGEGERVFRGKLLLKYNLLPHILTRFVDLFYSLYKKKP